MEQQNISTTRVALKYGIYIGAGSTILTIFLWVLKLEDVASLQLLDNVIWITGLVLAMQEFRRNNGGYMKFGQGFTIGLTGCFVAGLIDAFYASFHFRFLNTTFLPKLKEELLSQWEKSGMSDEQMEMLRPWAEFIATPNFIFLSAIIGAIFSGLILGLIISAILQKENTGNPFANN